MKKVAICTISSHNYMAYGLTCLLTAKKYNPCCDCFYLVADKYNEEYYKKYTKSIKFIDLFSIGIDNKSIINMAFKYNIVEFNTAIKPAFYSYLFSLGYDSVIYLDPDIECYSSFDEFLKSNSQHSIIVTPHKTSTINSKLIDDSAFLNNGIYNLGFIALNKTESTMLFLEWWNNKLKNQCFLDYPKGLATDQIWVELATTIFDGFYIDKNLGLNAAYWNIHERNICKNKDKWEAGGTTLVFFHFSSLSASCKEIFLNSIDDINPGFKEFYAEHINNVRQYELEKFSKIEYSFLKYSNGETITKGERWLYGFSSLLQEIYLEPFDVVKGSFYKDILQGRNICIKGLNREQKFIAILIKLIGVQRAINIFSRASTSGVRQIAKLYGKVDK